MNLDDRNISVALQRLNGELSAGWQVDVMRRMRRRALVRRVFASTAAAAAIAAVVVPLAFTGNQADYIYTDRYYSSLPPVTTSIPQQIDAILLADREKTLHFYEPYEPLPE